MLKGALTAAALAAVFTATPLMARDLLAPSNIHQGQSPEVSKAADLARSAEPFTTTPGRPTYVCSISGLGQTSKCVVRSWAERRGAAL